ncbi:uncharacterized protein LOC142549127 [Primulina tabacum]|uniref:uncharacterized protein LOC142549127 n=1 Tax=Primulina tabacum TaxID=48773 RepID=UPI003F5A8D3A
MKQIQECPTESQNTTNNADDAISLVFYKEARGRVRGMGFGVTPSKVGAYVQQNDAVKQLQDMMHNLQQEMLLVVAMVAVLGMKLVAIVISILVQREVVILIMLKNILLQLSQI